MLIVGTGVGGPLFFCLIEEKITLESLVNILKCCLSLLRPLVPLFAGGGLDNMVEFLYLSSGIQYSIFWLI